MPLIKYQGNSYQCDEQTSVLDCLARHGVTVPSSCRSGVCQSCLLQATKGAVPAAAQKDLRPTAVANGYLLACVCYPKEDLDVALPSADEQRWLNARLIASEQLSTDIFKLSVLCEEPIHYRAGQFVSLAREDGLVRTYSITNLPDGSGLLNFHVRHLPNGKMSGWLREIVDINRGEKIRISSPRGNCFYLPEPSTQPLLLAATGCGLAPLWGILHDALAQNHHGPIFLYHGSYSRDGLYYVDELRQLARDQPNFHYMPSTSHTAIDGFAHGLINQLVATDHNDLTGFRVYLCGNPDMVNTMKREAYLAGAKLQDIYADPFVIAKI